MRIRILTAVILACLVALPGFGESKAVLKNIQGKVEVKPMKGTWTAAKDGMEVSLMDTISTGFNSSAELKLEDNIVQVSPLTRLTLDKLLEQSGTLSTNLYLKVGKVTADVKSSKGLAQDFKVQSSYSTASVRGTKLIYDGVTLTVVEGNVNLIVGTPKRDFSQYLQKVIEERKGEKKEEAAVAAATSGTTEGTAGGSAGGTTGGTTEGTSEETGGTVDKEEVRVETVVDMEQLSKEEVAGILQDTINELVQSGDLDQESAAQVLETVTKVLENPQQPVEEIPVPEVNVIKVETGGTQSVTVPTAKQDVFIIKPQTQAQSEASGGTTGSTEPPKPEQTTARTKTRGSISIELEVK